DTIAALELYTVYVGERLGLYRALAEGGPATSTELAARTGTGERDVREGLGRRAASGLRAVDDPAAGPLERRYRMPPEHVPVLADPDHVDYQAYRGVEAVRAARPMPDLVEGVAPRRAGVGGWPGRPRRAPPGGGRPGAGAPRRRCPGSRRAGPSSTGPCSSTCSAAGGCRRSPRSTGACAPSRRPGWPTWPAAPAGRASPWPGRTRRSRWTASISTPTWWRPPPSTPTRRAWPAGCASRWSTPPTPACPEPTTWGPSSRPCTNWPGRWRRCGRCGRCWPRAGRW